MSKYGKTAEAIAGLTREQYRVTQEGGTERPRQRRAPANEEAGIYVDIVSGEPLFASSDKFESGCGWPSFTKPIEPANVNQLTDTPHGMVRTEVRSTHGDSHLGHVFDDGAEDLEGSDYCINSASLRFIHGRNGGRGLRRLPKPGGGQTMTEERVLLAGGCFWGVRDLLKYPGDIHAVGYLGSNTPNATYRNHGTHAEAVEVVFDPARISFRQILSSFSDHDPSTRNRPGTRRRHKLSVGQFRHTTDEQRGVAEARSPTSMRPGCGQTKKLMRSLLCG